jgi:large subunit ribosomal protein L5
MARLRDFYQKTVVPKLKQDLGLENVMQIPKITKITVNMGVGEAVADRKVMDAAVADLTKITGQKPKLCMSKKSIASFKVRENLAIGTMVTLRGERMWEFFDRLVTIAIPRIRDFSLGIKEQIIFPEIQYDQIDQLRGMDITITTTAKDNKQGKALLDAFNFPFRK